MHSPNADANKIMAEQKEADLGLWTAVSVRQVATEDRDSSLISVYKLEAAHSAAHRCKFSTYASGAHEDAP